MLVAHPQPIDVIVIGAGLSGLRAAVEVHNAGLSVTVFEGRDRVGGKTLSVAASHLGGKIDLGAAWINDTNQSEMYKLAREFGFDLVEQRATGMNLTRGSDGKLVKFPHGSKSPTPPEETEQLRAFWGALMKHISNAHPEWPHLSPEADRLDSMTFAEFAYEACKAEAGVAAANTLAASFLGVEAEETSALFMIDYIQSGTGLKNMGSDLKNGGQYLRNRQGEHLDSFMLFVGQLR